MKTGSVLSVVVTIFVMIALISAGLIVLLEKKIIYINPKYIMDSSSNSSNGEEIENNITVENYLDKYEGNIVGTTVKEMLQEISSQNLNSIIVYISEEEVILENASKENANTILMANAIITNSSQYNEIVDLNDYKVIIEKNSEKAVEKIYVIKISSNI